MVIQGGEVREILLAESAGCGMSTTCLKGEESQGEPTLRSINNNRLAPLGRSPRER